MSLSLPMFALVKREFISLIRARRALVILSLFLLVCIYAVARMWPSSVEMMEQASIVSTMLVASLTSMMLLACVLFVPALGATSVSVEREQDTLDSLRTTLISPSGILLGKMLNTVGFFLLLLLAALPVASTVFFLFGLDWVQMSQILFSLLLCAATCSMVGIYCSVRFERTYVAIGNAYAGVLLLALGSNIVGAVMMPVLGLWAARGARIFAVPYGMYGTIFGRSMSWVFGIWIYLIIIAVIFYSLALRRLRKAPVPPKIEGGSPIDDPWLLRKRRTTFPFYLIDPLARRKPIEDGRNPMLVRELRWGMASRGTFLARVFLASFAISLFGSFPALTGRGTDEMGTWFVFDMIAVVALAPALLANALTKERELGNLDMLRMTLLTPREIVAGKLSAGAVTIAPIILGVLLSSLGMVLLRVFSWRILLTGFTSLALCATICVCIGLYASLMTQRTSTALILSYGIAIALFAGPVILSEVVLAGSRSAAMPYDLGVMGAIGNVLRWMFSYVGSPIAVFVDSAAEPRHAEHHSLLPWVVNVAAYAILCRGVFLRSVHLFRERWMRNIWM